MWAATAVREGAHERARAVYRWRPSAAAALVSIGTACAERGRKGSRACARREPMLGFPVSVGWVRL